MEIRHLVSQLNLPGAVRRCLIVTVALASTGGIAHAGSLTSDYVTPPSTYSPDQRYGVMIPVFHLEVSDQEDSEDRRKNKVVDLQSGKIVATIPGEPGYDRALNFHEVAPPRWSPDGALLLWKVDGKWNPDALVLLKIDGNRAKWQLDLLHLAQQAVLTRTRKAKPGQYRAAKEANVGNGSAFPDGFTVDVITDGEDGKTVALPLSVHADLTANPKGDEDFPANLDSYLDAVVTADGNFVVKDFHLGKRHPED